MCLQDVAVFTDPFETYKQRLAKRLAREAEERAGAGKKAKAKEERDKDRTTYVVLLLIRFWRRVALLTTRSRTDGSERI